MMNVIILDLGYYTFGNWKLSYDLSDSNHDKKEKLSKILWRLKSHPRHTNLLWRILSETIPVRKTLIKKTVNSRLIFITSSDTIDHIYIKCAKANDI